MLPFINYELKILLVSLFFYIFYKLLMRNDTWFKLRRIVLLSSVILSLILPLCVITIQKEELVKIPEILVQGQSFTHLSESPQHTSSTFDMLILILTITIILGNAFMLMRFFHDLMKIVKLLNRLEYVKDEGFMIGLTDAPIPPFSFMQRIGMSRSDYMWDKHILISHESHHIRHHHTLDLLLMELYIVFQWFNPIAWKIREELHMVHEYEADEHVIRTTDSGSRYLNMLISRAASSSPSSLINTFSNKNILKRRLAVLSHKRSSRWCMIKGLFLVPLIFLALLSFSRTEVTYKNFYRESTSDKGELSSVSNKSNHLYSYVKDNSESNSQTTWSQSVYDSIMQTLPFSDSVAVYRSNRGTVSQVNDIMISKVRIIEGDQYPQPDASLQSASDKSNILLKDTVLKEIDKDQFLLTHNAADPPADLKSRVLSSSELMPVKNDRYSSTTHTSNNADMSLSMELSSYADNTYLNVNAYKISISNNASYIVILNKQSLYSSSNLSTERLASDNPAQSESELPKSDG